MNIRFWRLSLVVGAAIALTGCGSHRETREALLKAHGLEDQKQYQDANAVLVEALRAREAVIRAGETATDAASADAMKKKVQADPDIVKMEHAQISIYLHLERADLASAVYADILAGRPGDTIVYDIFRNPDPVIRVGAVRILGLAGKPDAIPTLTKATQDDDKDVRRAAIAALGAIKDPTAVDPLIAALKDSYWFARSEAASSLGRQGDLRAINPLLNAVADTDSNVESSAESALLLLVTTPGVAVDDFAIRLNDPNPKIVMISAVCLAELKDSRAIPILVKLTSSPDLTTRLQALKALGEAGDPSAIPLLRQSLKDPDINIRGWSIIGLGNLKDTDSLPALNAIAANTSEPTTIRSAATAAITHMNGKPATAGTP